MEAADLGRGSREADVAPAPPAAERVWWGPADPAPLGLAGFALTTFILGLVNANLLSGKDVFVVLMFLTLWIAFLLLGIGSLGGGHKTITHWGGYVTTACAVLAWYVSAAHVINHYFGRTLLPLRPFTSA